MGSREGALATGLTSLFVHVHSRGPPGISDNAKTARRLGFLLADARAQISASPLPTPPLDSLAKIHCTALQAYHHHLAALACLCCGGS